MSQGGNPRRERVAQAMRDVLAELIDRELKDPRVREAGLASIHHVELNRDMSVARIYVSFLGPAEHDERLRARALTGLQASAGFLRGPVGRRLGLRHAPELRFVVDDSVAFQQRITELVRAEDTTPAADEPASDAGDTAQGAGDAGEE